MAGSVAGAGGRVAVVCFDARLAQTFQVAIVLRYPAVGVVVGEQAGQIGQVDFGNAQVVVAGGLQQAFDQQQIGDQVGGVLGGGAQLAGRCSEVEAGMQLQRG